MVSSVKSQSSKKETSLEVPKCFVIMPISKQHNYDDDHFKLVYEDIIKPSVEEAGMFPLRADETKNTNLIQLDILRNVIEAPIAVCDMSSKNPNVFYELGMRQAFDMPTVLMIDNETNVPFDINGLRYVVYNKEMRHRDVIKAKVDLLDALKSTYSKKDDKAEINSLVRLMDLANPAKLNGTDLPAEKRYELLTEIHLKEIQASISYLEQSQHKIANALAGMAMNYNTPPWERESKKRAGLSLKEIEKRLKNNSMAALKVHGPMTDEEVESLL